jgi:hypothetical protein
VRKFWIDAICINQDDLDEKSAQIPLMAQIYPQAEAVNVWLGPSDKHSNRALKFIKNNVLKLWEFDDLCRKNRDNDMSEDWYAFTELLNRNWFSRRWVVQEIALANPAKAIILCGEQTITWQEFSDAVSLFIEAESKSHRLSEVMKASTTHNLYQDFFGHIPASGAALLVNTTNNLFRRSKDGGRESTSTLEYLVCTLSIFNSSNPRDIIYALLAIAKDTQADSGRLETPNESMEKSPEVRQQLRVWAHAKALAARLAKDQGFAAHSYHVDYRLPVIDVYKDFVLFAIRKAEPQRALDIIGRPWAPPATAGEPALPSWICTLTKAPYDVSKRPNLGMRMDRKNGDPFVGTPDVAGRNYNAAGSKVITTSKFKFRKGGGYYSMFVEGFILDEVKRGELLSAPSENGNIPANWRSMMRSKDGTSTEEDFWRTLVADRGRDGMNPPAFYPRACEEIFHTGTTDGPIDANRLIHESNCTIVAEFLRRVMEVICNRRMMRTKSLNKLGLFPSETRSGDLICILYGCSVPVVLRRKEKTQEQIDADAQLDSEENRRRVRTIQNAFRKRRDYKAGKAMRKNARFRAYLWDLVRLYVFGSTSFNILSYLAMLGLLSWMLSLDLFGWTRSSCTVSKTVLVVALETILAESMDSRASFAVLVSLPVGPIVLWLWRRLRSMYLTFWARLKSRPVDEILAGRPSGFYYKLVGECYVHGVMNGEALGLYNEARTGSYKSSEIAMNGHASQGATEKPSEGAAPSDTERPLQRMLTLSLMKGLLGSSSADTSGQPTRRGNKRKAKKAKQQRRKDANKKEDDRLPEVEFFRNVTFEIR